MWCSWNLRGGSINRHCLLLLGSLGALTPLRFVFIPFLAIIFLLGLSLRWLLTLLVVVVIQLLRQSLSTVESFGICSYHVSLDWRG